MRDNIWHFVVATLETKRFQDDAHYKKDVFYRKKIYDDNDDDDVDDDVDYEEITAPLIHNLSIVFLSKLRTIEMYIKNQRTFKNYLGQYLLGDSPYQRNRLMPDF